MIGMEYQEKRQSPFDSRTGDILPIRLGKHHMQKICTVIEMGIWVIKGFADRHPIGPGCYGPNLGEEQGGSSIKTMPL